MLKIFSFLVLFAFCAAPIAAQDKKQILSVDRETIKIQKGIRQFQVKKGELFDISTEGATTKAFYDKNQIRKTSAEIFGEMGKTAVEFFYRNGKLIFVSRKQSNYDQPFGKIIKTTIQKFYFADDKLISLIDNGKQVSKTTAEFAEQKQQTLDLSNKILDNFKN